jgi:hypothetical protein
MGELVIAQFCAYYVLRIIQFNFDLDIVMQTCYAAMQFYAINPEKGVYTVILTVFFALNEI